MLHFVLALLFSGILWAGCAGFGKLISTYFSLSLLQHGLCLIVAVVSCICFFSIFKLNAATGYLKGIQTTITEVTQKAESDEEMIELQKKIRKEYPLISKFTDSKAITNTANFSLNEVIKKVSSYRNRFVFTLIFFQLIAYGMVWYSSAMNNTRSPRQNAQKRRYRDYDL